MRIGIYGGTFDPPHIGHIEAFKSFLKSFDLDKAFVIPVYLPPHKQVQSASTVNDRLNMSRIAFEGISENVFVSDVEIKRQGKSYTADTIAHFKNEGYEEIYFLCGTDMILTMDRWYKPDYIFENATIVYVRRETDVENTKMIDVKVKEYENRFGAKIFPLYTNVIEVSSTEVRDSVALGEFSYLTEGIKRYIIEGGLYR